MDRRGWRAADGAALRAADQEEVGRPWRRARRRTRLDADGSDLRIIGFECRIMIAYRVEKPRIIIARVFYGGQDWERALRGNEPGAD